MHSTDTINQFLNLRAQGWSFARIADHLHISKPTLIQWSYKRQSELAATKAGQGCSVQAAAQASHELQLEHFALFLTTLHQKLIKRTLRSFSNEELDTLADEIEQQVEKLSGKEK
jgi:hypothetical protein